VWQITKSIDMIAIANARRRGEKSDMTKLQAPTTRSCLAMQCGKARFSVWELGWPLSSVFQGMNKVSRIVLDIGAIFLVDIEKVRVQAQYCDFLTGYRLLTANGDNYLQKSAAQRRDAEHLKAWVMIGKCKDASHLTPDSSLSDRHVIYNSRAV